MLSIDIYLHEFDIDCFNVVIKVDYTNDKSNSFRTLLNFWFKCFGLNLNILKV
jgi:hypothetical protein